MKHGRHGLNGLNGLWVLFVWLWGTGAALAQAPFNEARHLWVSADLAKPETALRDAVTNRQPRVAWGNPLTVHVAFYNGASLVTDFTGLETLYLEIKETRTDEAGVPLVLEDLAAGAVDATLTAEQWAARTNEHVTFTLTAAQLQTTQRRLAEKNVWWILHAARAGAAPLLLGMGEVTVYSTNATPTDTPAPALAATYPLPSEITSRWLPAGGTTGQVLAKTSAADYAAGWITASGTGDMLASANLSDVANVATARTNLGLGTAATAAAGDFGAGREGILRLGATPQIIPEAHAADHIDRRIAGLTANDASKQIYSTLTHAGAGSYVRSTTSWVTDIDLTCLAAYNSNGLGTPGGDGAPTALSPRHVYMAHHFTTSWANGATVRFVTAANAIVGRTIIDSARVGSTDIRIALLDSALPDTIRFARVLPADYADVLDVAGLPVLYTDQDMRAHVADLQQIGIMVASGDAQRIAFYEALVDGDSGAPVFLIIDGEPVLLPSDASYSAVNDTLIALGGGYELTTIPLPATSPMIPWANITDAPATTGDVVGPGSATDNAIARYDSTTGKLLQGSLATIGDTGALATPSTVTASGYTIQHATLGLAVTDYLSGTGSLGTHFQARQRASGTIAMLENNLGQFAATTSAELAAVLSDETGSGGGFVRATSPTLTTPAITGAYTATTASSADGLSIYSQLVDSSLATGKIWMGLHRTSGVSYPGIWGGNITPSISNYMLLTDGSGVFYNTTNNLAFRIANVSKLRVINVGSLASVGIGDHSPTAALDLRAGSAAANTAPMKFRSGPLLTTPEEGTLEYLSGVLYFTDATPTRQIVNLGGGGGDALVANPLSQFAATTSAQLAGVISDETGTGLAVFGTSPTLTTPTMTAPVLGTIASGDGGTLTNLNGENVQNDTIDDDSIDFGTGADQVSAVDIPIEDVGLLYAATNVEDALFDVVKVVTKTTAVSYTAGTTNVREYYGGVIYVTGAATITLPVAADGMSLTVIVVGAVSVSVKPNAADRLVLDGVTLDDGDKATSTGTTGEIIVLTYYSADGWYAASDGWTDGGP